MIHTITLKYNNKKELAKEGYEVGVHKGSTFNP